MGVTIRKGNLSPSIFDTIRQAGVAFDLTGSSVKLKARLDTAITLKIDAAATVVSASSTLSVETTLPEPSITIASTAGFLPRGALNVGSQVVEYEEISGNTFLGCRGGAGTIAAAAAVSQRGGVRYDQVAGDVDTAGDYIAWWEVTLPSTKKQETPLFDLVVEDPTVVFEGLCELADVTAYAPGYRGDGETNALLERLILAETRSMKEATRREFRAHAPAVNPRRFDIGHWELERRCVYVGDLQPTGILYVRVYDDDQATLLETVSSANYVLVPRVRDAWEPVTEISFPAFSPTPAELQLGYVLEVSGTWGFPSVPADVREACAKRVVVSYLADAATAGTEFSEALEGVSASALFASAQDVIRRYSVFP